MNIIKNVDALEECAKAMRIYEEKYGISTECFLAAQYEPGAITAEDKDIWDFYIDVFIDAGGNLESRYEHQNCQNDELFIRNTPIYTKPESVLITDSIKKEEVKPLFFCFL